MGNLDGPLAPLCSHGGAPERRSAQVFLECSQYHHVARLQRLPRGRRAVGLLEQVRVDAERDRRVGMPELARRGSRGGFRSTRCATGFASLLIAKKLNPVFVPPP